MITELQKQELFSLARMSGEVGDSMIRGFSGADQADSELYFGERRVYVAVAMGAEIETAIAAEDKRWREYAEGQRRKVDDAPKIKQGPMSGASAIHYRWVSPDAFEAKARHIRSMIKITKEKVY